ncbi:MAG: histidine kinase [Tannerellaceae bacterium]|jgi:ligand-binding sensor domain-containing protein|nr:histidine kinase [Tannerellaceae bacterium]
MERRFASNSLLFFLARPVLGLLFLFVCENTLAAGEALLNSEYSYRRYTISDGLPDQIITSVSQDSKGFIWAGTIRGGFTRFDGQRFKNFDSHGLSIVEFTEHEQQVVALGLLSSFCVSGSDSVRPVKMVSSSSDIYCWYNSKTLPKGYGVYSIDNKKALYALTDTGLVVEWEHELLNQMRDGSALYWDKPNRRFMIPAGNRGVYVVHENGTVENHFDAGVITNFIPYRNSLWAAGYNGLYEYRDGRLELMFEYPFFDGESADVQLLEDSEHNLLIRTISCLYRYRNGKLETITDKLVSSRDMLVDNDGNIWIAAANGLFNYYKLNFQNHTILPEGSISQSIVVDGQNNVWLPTFDGRLLRMENGKASIAKHPPSPAGYSFFERGSVMKDNRIYFSGGAGILQYDCDRNSFRWMPGFPPSLVQYISVLPDGGLVAGNTTAAMIYHPEEGIKRIYEAAELKQQILTSCVDKQGNILLGGTGGITMIDGDSIRFLNDEILKMCVYITCDGNGKLWMICRNRLVSMENDTPEVAYTFGKDLCNLYITRSGMLIVTTNDELFIAPGGKQLDFVRYDRNNGYLNAFAITGTHIAEDAEGAVFISTIEKTISFHPGNLLDKLKPPGFYLQDIAASVDNVHWNTFDADNLRLDYRHKNIRFAYVGLNYSAAENVRYHYRLAGFQDEWSEPSPMREVTFNNLPPGDYTFEIYADAGTDESRSEMHSFAFSITPAFWQTTWFPAMCVIALVLASAGVALYVQRRKNRALLEKLRAEKELNELRISSIRLKAIPHFNANVLSAIEYYIANRTKEEAMRILGIYSDFTCKTLSEVDKASRPLADELAYVKMYLDLEKIRFMEKFDFRIEVEKGVDETVHLPNMILHTYCENAVKHGLMPLKSGGLLAIRVSQRGRTVCVSVEDNGAGRDYARQNKHLHSSKQGLSILNRQIEIYNRFNREKITSQVDDLFNNGKPSGTCFSVEVPLEYTYV